MQNDETMTSPETFDASPGDSSHSRLDRLQRHFSEWYVKSGQATKYQLIRNRLAAESRARRSQRGDTQQDAADELGCSREQIAKLEDPTRLSYNPRLTDLAALLVYLRAQPADMLGDPWEPEPHQDEEWLTACRAGSAAKLLRTRIGYAVNRERLERGISTAELGQLLRVHPSQAGKILDVKRGYNPRLTDLVTILTMLELTPEQLFGPAA